MTLRFSQLPLVLEDTFGPLDPVVPDPHRKNASVALVLRPGDGDRDPLARRSDVLMIKRSVSERDPWSGHMALPGGRLEERDPSLLAAAVRETLEETALDLSHQASVVGRIEPVRPMGVPIPVISIWPFVFQATPGSAARSNSFEVASVHWFPLEALLDEENRGVHTLRRGSSIREYPCIRVDGHVIWGLTYRIFTQFFGVL